MNARLDLRLAALVDRGLGPNGSSLDQVARLTPEAQEHLAILMEEELRNDPVLQSDDAKRARYWRIHISGSKATACSDQSERAAAMRAAPNGDARDSVAEGGIQVIPFASVEPRPVCWLWNGFIPLSAVTILDGDPGLGKSTLMIDIAARVSRGLNMPDDSGPVDAAGVLILSAEDDPRSVIRPRLDAAGANSERVITLQVVQKDGTPRDPLIRTDDLQLVEDVVRTHGVGLVVVDPLVAFLPGEINVNRDQDVRRAMAQLRRLAERARAAVVVVRHLRKAWSENALYRGGGSIGVIGAARVGLLVAPDPRDTTGERRILAITKMNIAPVTRSRAFRLIAEPGASHPHVHWEGESELSARALLVVPQSEEERGAREEAEEFLRDVLSEGPRPASAVEDEARQAGIAKSTLRRAKRALRVKAQKVGRPGDEGQHWVCALPSKVLSNG